MKNQPLDDFSRSARDVAHLLLAREVADPLLQRHRLRDDPIGLNGYAAFDERNQPRDEDCHQVLGIGSYQQFPAMGSDPIDLHVHADCGITLAVHLDPPVCLCFCTAAVASAFQVTLYQIGGSFAFGGETCGHADTRGASRRKRVSACLQVAFRHYQLSKNDSHPLSEKKPFYIIPDPNKLRRL